MEKQDMSQVAKTIRSLMREKKYREVVKIAKGLNLNRINNGLLILDIVEAYEKLGDKKAAKVALLNYYDVHGITGRNMMQKLIELCIETRDISNAVGLCMEFENEWPESSISYLMRYQITTSAGGSLDERIYYLEKYKETEFEERWGYELAKLYDKNNQKEECAEVCHEIICFFGTGKYVEKAVQLKERTIGLTEDEINIVETAKRREEEAREKREEEERLAREEMARLAEEEARRIREQEERRRQEEEHRRHEEELRLRAIAEEQAELQQQEEKYRHLKEAEGREAGYFSWVQSSASAINEERILSRIPDETEEEYAARRARQAKDEKIRQTEEAARLLREKKEADRIAREQKIAEALKTSDRYAQIEKNRSEEIYFDDIIKQPTLSGEKPKQKKSASEGKHIFSSFGRMASNVRKTLQPDEDYLEEDDASAEIEYITVGRDSRAYAEDIEERMLSELDMLDDDQIEELTSTQIKEIYELKVLHDVRASIKALVVDMNDRYNVETREEELDRFVNTDPYVNPLEEQEESEPVVESGEKEKTGAETEIEEKASVGAEEETDVETGAEKNAAGIEEEISVEPETEEITVEPEETGVEPETEEITVESEETGAEPEIEEVTVEPEETGAEPEIEEVTVEPGETDVEPEIEEVTAEPEETGAEPEIEEVTVEPEETGAEPETEEAAAEVEEETFVEPEAETIVKEKEEQLGESEEAKKEEPLAEPEVKETILDRIADPDANLTVKEFSECITAYAGLKGYQVEDTAYMTIAVLAEEMQNKETPLSLNNAKIMADDAITRIQKRNPLDKIVDRYSKKHAYLLKDKHFYWKV